MDEMEGSAEETVALNGNAGTEDASGFRTEAIGNETVPESAAPMKPNENGSLPTLAPAGAGMVRSSSATTLNFPGGPHSSLLRLFQSEMFDSRMCLHYLQRYGDSVGVQYYLCTKALPSFPVKEIDFLLPQLLHLLIVRGPEIGHELQKFLLKRCEEHHHVSLMVLWLLQGYVYDFRNEVSKLSDRGRYVAKLYQKVQSLMFSPDSETSSTSNERGFAAGVPILRKLASAPGLANGRPRNGSNPAAVQQSPAPRVNVNVAPMLVGIGSIMGAIGLPALAEVTKDIVISQSGRTGLQDTDVFPAGEGLLEQSRALVLVPVGSKAEELDSNGPLPSPVRAIPTLEALSQGAAFLSRSESVGSQTYFQSTLKFFATLSQISYRLRTVPRHGRQSLLQAELELLNHNLPADVCLPMWCPAKGRGETVWHHKIVAVAAHDSVVLNSAERVSYLGFFLIVVAFY